MCESINSKWHRKGRLYKNAYKRIFEDSHYDKNAIIEFLNILLLVGWLYICVLKLCVPCSKIPQKLMKTMHDVHLKVFPFSRYQTSLASKVDLIWFPTKLYIASLTQRIIFYISRTRFCIILKKNVKIMTNSYRCIAVDGQQRF